MDKPIRKGSLYGTMTDSANTTVDMDAEPRRELWILLAFLFTFMVVVICWGSVHGLVLFFNRYGMIVTEPEQDIDDDDDDDDDDERVGGGDTEDTEAQGGERLRPRRNTSTRRRRTRRKKRCGNVCCCCLGPNVRLRIDWEAYRREQESMRQLRAQRRLNRMQILQMAQTMRNSGIPQNTTIPNPQQRPIEFTTFSQIPGPIPNSFWAAQNGVATSARGTPLGFIVFPQLQPPSTNNTNNSSGGPVDVTSFQHRNHLTQAQRRQFLEKVLVCIPYASSLRQQECEEEQQQPQQELSETREDEEEAANHVSAQRGSSTTEAMEEGRSVAQDQVQDRQDGPKEDDGQPNAAPKDQPTSATASSSGRYRNHHDQDANEPPPPPLQGQQDTIASHSEPTDVANTCAICLENFEEGDLINDNSSKCAHFFHRECLLAWLDKHNICPCCRRPMITDWEWRAAIGDTPLELNTTAAAATTTQGMTASRGAAVATTTTQFSATRMMYTRNPTRGLVSMAPAARPSSSSSGAS